jgi:hypothetical protein
MFAQYDPLAARVPAYARAYPFIELAVGMFYLAGIVPVFTNIVLILILGITTVGVVRVMVTGTKVECGCAGANFNLPVGRVTLFENVLMIAMAMASLVFHL